MRFGLQVNNFTWPGGAARMGELLGRVTRTADEAGFDSIWVMDHFFQIRGAGGPPEAPMLEGQTALGFMAANSARARLGLMVGGIHYRLPGLWIKATTTLDVLSGGRAWFGIGAAWNEEESRGLGFPMPPLRDRFEMLEECLQMAQAAWSGGTGGGPFEGRHYTATRLLNSPQAISRPRVPILVGGGGEQKTLRLVAQYADACNIFGRNPGFVRHKLDVLREHCERLGRPYQEIEKTVLTSVDPATEEPPATVERFGGLAEAGAEHIIFSVRGVADTSRLERIAAEVLPQLR